MGNKLTTTFTLVLLIVLLVIGIWSLTLYFAHLPEKVSRQETLVFGQNRGAPGSQEMVYVRNLREVIPLTHRQAKILLNAPTSPSSADGRYNPYVSGEAQLLTFTVPHKQRRPIYRKETNGRGLPPAEIICRHPGL